MGIWLARDQTLRFRQRLLSVDYDQQIFKGCPIATKKRSLFTLVAVHFNFLFFEIVFSLLGFD